MSKGIITSLGISASPKSAKQGDKIAIELNTKNAAGGDPGPDAVIAAGLCYRTGLDVLWVPASGASQQTHLQGTGGTPPVWTDDSHTAVEPGTGPNPGYTDEVPEGFNMGATKWISELGFGYMLKVFSPGPGLLQLKGHLYDVDGKELFQTITLDVQVS